jgi:hypothetical protein
MLLSNGQALEYARPDPAVLSVDVLARSLSRLPRFCGHTLGDHAYSVAQHSVIVSGLVPRRIALAALLHDAHEAFTSDIPTPVKRSVDGIRDVERTLDEAVYTWAGLEPPLPPIGNDWELIHFADVAALAAELRDLMPPPPRPIPEPRTPYVVRDRIVPWPPAVAAKKWRSRLVSLAPHLDCPAILA